MTLAARIAPRLPPALIATGVALLYPRYEPELRRLADFCPAGGTAVDVGGWYGPWSRRLARRADRVVVIEPVPHLARVLAATTPVHVDVVNAAATDRDGGTALHLVDLFTQSGECRYEFLFAADLTSPHQAVEHCA